MNYTNDEFNAALERLNKKQNAANVFTNITAADVENEIREMRKHARPVTKTQAAEQIKALKDHTAYFNYDVTYNEMREMLKYRMGFGDAETTVILAALILAGAKF